MNAHFKTSLSLSYCFLSLVAGQGDSLKRKIVLLQRLSLILTLQQLPHRSNLQYYQKCHYKHHTSLDYNI